MANKPTERGTLGTVLSLRPESAAATSGPKTNEGY